MAFVGQVLPRGRFGPRLTGTFLLLSIMCLPGPEVQGLLASKAGFSADTRKVQGLMAMADGKLGAERTGIGEGGRRVFTVQSDKRHRYGWIESVGGQKAPPLSSQPPTSSARVGGRTRWNGSGPFLGRRSSATGGRAITLRESRSRPDPYQPPPPAGGGGARDPRPQSISVLYTFSSVGETVLSSETLPSREPEESTLTSDPPYQKFYEFQLRREEFDTAYNLRQNEESANSAIKRKLGEHLLSKN